MRVDLDLVKGNPFDFTALLANLDKLQVRKAYNECPSLCMCKVSLALVSHSQTLTDSASLASPIIQL